MYSEWIRARVYFIIIIIEICDFYYFFVAYVF